MTVFQIILLVFIGFVLVKIFFKYQEKLIGRRELFFWTAVWLGAALLTIYPGTTSLLATQVGVGRGVDLVVYLALVVIFYFMFKVLVKLERAEKNLTEVVRKIALDQPTGADQPIKSKWQKSE